MASAHRCTFTSAIPVEAVIRTVDGQKVACWVDRKGQKVTAPILANGKCQRTAPGRWYGTYRDHNGRQKKTTTFGSKTHALEMAIRLERKAGAVRDGRESPDRPSGRILLVDQVGDYLEFLRVDRGTGAKRRKTVEGIITEVIRRHRLTTAGAVNCDRLLQQLETDRVTGGFRPLQLGEVREPLSLRSRNMWVVTLRAFGNWLRKKKRADSNPFEDLPTVNAEVDRRRVRRALPAESFAAVVVAARNSTDVVQGLDGVDRAMMYTLGAYTGLRAGALRQLTPEAFTWNTGVPSGVFSSARLQKNKGAHGIGIVPEIAATLGAWLRTRTPGEPIFQGNIHMRTADMLKHDLAAAKVPYRDAAGEVFDFHSLRIQTGYFMWAGGVPFVAAVEILDHSDPKLTAKIYSKFGGELGLEMAKLPVPAGITGASLGTPLGTEPLQTPPNVRKLVDKKTPPKKKKPHKS